jgi:hypothetical protein
LALCHTEHMVRFWQQEVSLNCQMTGLFKKSSFNRRLTGLIYACVCGRVKTYVLYCSEHVVLVSPFASFLSRGICRFVWGIINRYSIDYYSFQRFHQQSNHSQQLNVVGCYKPLGCDYCIILCQTQTESLR